MKKALKTQGKSSTAQHCFQVRLVNHSPFRFLITTATNPGENFIGQVFRVKIEQSVKKKSLSLIFKVPSPSKTRRDMLGSDELFRIESEMYQTVLPTLNDLLKKRGLSNSLIFPGTARFVINSFSLIKD